MRDMGIVSAALSQIDSLSGKDKIETAATLCTGLILKLVDDFGSHETAGLLIAAIRDINEYDPLGVEIKASNGAVIVPMTGEIEKIKAH